MLHREINSKRFVTHIHSIPADSKEGFNADTPKDREYCTVVNFKIVRFRRMEEQDVKMIFFPLKNGGKCSFYIYMYMQGLWVSEQPIKSLGWWHNENLYVSGQGLL